MLHVDPNPQSQYHLIVAWVREGAATRTSSVPCMTTRGSRTPECTSMNLCLYQACSVGGGCNLARFGSPEPGLGATCIWNAYHAHKKIHLILVFVKDSGLYCSWTRQQSAERKLSPEDAKNKCFSMSGKVCQRQNSLWFPVIQWLQVTSKIYYKLCRVCSTFF